MFAPMVRLVGLCNNAKADEKVFSVSEDASRSDRITEYVYLTVYWHLPNINFVV